MQDSLFEEEFKLHKWMMHTMDQIRERFATQKVYPRGNPGPYKSYRYINEERRKRGKWHSTGLAYTDQELYAKIWTAADGDTDKVDFFYNHVLDFVKWGVGKGRKIEQATEGRKDNAHPLTLFAKWGMPKELRKGKLRGRLSDSPRRSRPGVRQEIMHQATRLRRLASIHYGHYVETHILPEDMIGISIKHNSDPNVWIKVEDSRNL